MLARLQPELEAVFEFQSRERAQGFNVYPEEPQILNALKTPIDRVRVLILGQDPYPTAGHANGLAFSVAPGVWPLPRSLSNIFQELRSDLGAAPAGGVWEDAVSETGAGSVRGESDCAESQSGGVPLRSGDLTRWQQQGVMLMNRVLTVRQGEAGSHRGRGWEEITEQLIRTLCARGRPLVVVLWGRQAQTVIPVLGGVSYLTSAHPSPLSARRGFFGSKPFSKINELLAEQDEQAIDWKL